MKKNKMEWTKGYRNELLQQKGFYISYNPITDKGEETALVRGNKFYILLGNHKKQYEKLVSKGYRECKKYFTSNKHLRSSWSN